MRIYSKRAQVPGSVIIDGEHLKPSLCFITIEDVCTFPTQIQARFLVNHYPLCTDG
jgi:hypothetical protein